LRNLRDMIADNNS